MIIGQRRGALRFHGGIEHHLFAFAKERDGKIGLQAHFPAADGDAAAGGDIKVVVLHDDLHQFADGDIFAHNIQRVLGADLFALAAADTVFIAVDEMLHFAVFFRPIMNSRRADVDAVAAVNAFIL